jgi:hypothetical protein
VIAITTEQALQDDAVRMLRADNGTRWQLVFPGVVPPGLVSGRCLLPLTHLSTYPSSPYAAFYLIHACALKQPAEMKHICQCYIIDAQPTDAQVSDN